MSDDGDDDPSPFTLPQPRPLTCLRCQVPLRHNEALNVPTCPYHDAAAKMVAFLREAATLDDEVAWEHPMIPRLAQEARGLLAHINTSTRA